MVADQPSGGRYQFLETLRQYAAEKLSDSGELAAIHTRHRDWFLALSDRFAHDSFGSEPLATVDRFDRERDNFRAALEWSRAEPEGGARVGLQRRSLEESLTLTRAIGNPIMLNRALLHLSVLERYEGDFGRARERFAEAMTTRLNAAGFVGGAAQVSELSLAWAEGDRDGARATLKSLLASRWCDGDSYNAATLLCLLGAFAIADGDAERGVRLIGSGAVVNPHFGSVHQPSVHLDAATALTRARASHGEETFVRAWTAGQAIAPDQAFTAALSGEE